ncbi:MAG: DUF1566 domain-containing protein [Nitrospirota bacterium]
MKKILSGCIWESFVLVLSFLAAIALSAVTDAADFRHVLISTGSINNGFLNTKQILRTSSGKIYYVIGNSGHTAASNGLVEVHTSSTGENWIQVGSHNEYSSGFAAGVAIDSQDVVHMITFNWNKQPYYKKFHTGDSPRGDHTWEGFELLEGQKTGNRSRCAIAVDANDVPHIVYQLYESYKGKTYSTLYYANRVGGVWNKITLCPKEARALKCDILDIAIGPDNIPYILSDSGLTRGNTNKPSYFLPDKYFGPYEKPSSFVIHQNGDVRIAVISDEKHHIDYLHDHTQAWTSGWTRYDSGISSTHPLLVLSDDVQYTVDSAKDGSVTVRRAFDQPIPVAIPDTETGPFHSITTKWSFYNNHSPGGIIDIGLQSYQPSGGTTGNFYWYTSYLLRIKSAFSASPTEGLKPLTVTFRDDSFTANGGAIASWSWDFNSDGIIDSTLQNPVFTYANSGKYTVRLTVTDLLGNSDTTIKKDYIEVATDSDEDGILDSKDNCPSAYNASQVDLDNDGIGDICDSRIDLISQAIISTGLKTATSAEINSADITAIVKDGLLDQTKRIQKGKKGHDVVSFRANINAAEVESFLLSLYVNSLYGGVPQTVRIYAYNADGVTVQTSQTLTVTLYTGWNDIDATPLLHLMDGFGFVKFRIVAPQNWVDVSEAWITAESAVGLDEWEISVNLPHMDFGSIDTGGYAWAALTVSNTGKGDLKIGTISIQGEHFRIISDECSGRTISDATSCNIIVDFLPQKEGMFDAALTIPSNDRDAPRLSVRLTGTALPPVAIAGTVTDALSGLPLSGVSVSVSVPRSISPSPGDYKYSGGSFSPEHLPSDNKDLPILLNPYTRDYSNVVASDDEMKGTIAGSCSCGSYDSCYTMNLFKVRNPLNIFDHIKASWNGVAGSTADESFGQSFTPGRNGLLTKVSLLLSRWPNANPLGYLSVNVKSSVANEAEHVLATSEPVPASTVMPLVDSSAYSWIDFNFPDPAALTSGKTYYLEIFKPYNDSNLVVGSSGFDHYTGGKGYVRYAGRWLENSPYPYAPDHFDLAFRTYIDNRIDQTQERYADNYLYTNTNGVRGESVYMDVFNTKSGLWERLDSNNGGYYDFYLTAHVQENPHEYYDENGFVSFRIYSRAESVCYLYLTTDVFKLNFLDFQHAVSDSRGAFNLPTIISGNYTAVFDMPGYETKTLTGTLMSGQKLTLDVQLTPLVRTALTGNVTDYSTGLPLSEVLVTVTDSLSSHSTTTDLNGNFIDMNISPGIFTVTFEKSGFLRQEVSGTLTFGETQMLNISLPPLPPLVVTIASPPHGAIVDSSWLTVSGTVSSNANVSVNGIPVPVSNNAFSAIIPLKEGANAITATAADIYGQTAAHSITVTLSGLLDEEELFANPAALDFGSVTVGAARTLTLALSNIGTANLSINQITASPPFMVTDYNACSWQILAPSTSCSVRIKFVPTVEGYFSGTLQIHSGDADRPIVTIRLTGTADLYLSGYLLPDTGQTDCFDSSGNITECSPALGQDGGYTINPLSYAEDSPVSVTDRNTGLTWQREDDGIPRSWTAAANYCENLLLDSYDDWRLPTYFELLTIVDYGRNNPSIDLLAFPGTKPSCYWSSATDLDRAKAISFDYGTSAILAQSSVNSVRCVRGAALPDGFFSDNFNDTLTDWDTGFMWTDGYFSARTWNQALYWCNVLEVGGYTDWRLPDIKELLSKNYTDCYLGDCAAWSSTTFLQPDAAGEYTQALVYNNIDIVPLDKSNAHIFRCVRGGWGTFKGMVNGTVTDSITGLPVSSAEVSLTDALDITLTARTDADGNYSIADVSPGEFTAMFSKTGYASQRISNTIASGQVVVMNASLVKQFATTTVGDYGNITVIEMTGDYRAKNPDGSVNALPRQEIAKEFLRTHQDSYDFLILFSNFDFSMPDADAKAFYLEVKNDVQGIGKQIFDNSKLFGSNSRLQGMIDMGNIATIAANPADPKFDETLSLLAHEQLHRWGAKVKFKDSGGENSTALLGKEGSHWSFLLDSDGSVMYGNDWRDNGDGSFSSVAAATYYSPLDLYLMGMLDKSDVPPMLLIGNPGIDPARMPEVGAVISGTSRYITIDDIIAAERERIPDASVSQKSFRTAFILITRPGTFTGNELAGIENIRNAWAGRFATLTNGKGSIEEVAPSISISIASPSEGEMISRPEVTVRGTIINNTGKETGVTVNGMVATVYGNRFIANHVPLTEGSNTITITAIDTAGNTATTSIIVNAVTAGNYITMTSNIESGIAPLEVALRIDGSFSIDESSLSITGPVQPEIISSSPEEYTVKMINEGIYSLTVTAIGPDGLSYQDTIGIIVLNRTQMDRLLKEKWEGMRGALATGNINEAVVNFDTDSHLIYKDQFTALSPILSDIVNELNTAQVNMISTENRIAEYEIVVSREGTSFSIQLKFIKSNDGLWKIWNF